MTNFSHWLWVLWSTDNVLSRVQICIISLYHDTDMPVTIIRQILFSTCIHIPPIFFLFFSTSVSFVPDTEQNKRCYVVKSRQNRGRTNTDINSYHIHITYHFFDVSTNVTVSQWIIIVFHVISWYASISLAERIIR